MSKSLDVVNVRLDKAVIDRLDAIAAVLRRPGRKPVRSDAILAALYSGLEAFERDPSLIERAKTKKQGSRQTSAKPPAH